MMEALVKIAAYSTALDVALTGSTAGRRRMGWGREGQNAEQRRQRGRKLEPL
jgi:hypothetical protein